MKEVITVFMIIMMRENGYIYIINKTQLQTPTDCFTPWRDHQGDLIQIDIYISTQLYRLRFCD